MFLVMFFNFFYTSIVVNPLKISEEIKKSKGFIPGIKPGKSTSSFINKILNRITFPSSFFLAIIAVFPSFAYFLGVSKLFSQFYGGTSLLIIIGVFLDISQQIKSYLLVNKYNNISNMVKRKKIYNFFYS